MIPYQHCSIYTSVLFYFVTKFLCYIVQFCRISMYDKRKSTLSSIPEYEVEETNFIAKWVPKKKHEVLKAKYKCLKKLFQIYDASIIGILPEQSGNEIDASEDDKPKHSRRKKRSNRTKTDACAGTTEVSNGDVTDSENRLIATGVLKDLNLQCSYISAESDEKSIFYEKSTQDWKETRFNNDKSCNCTQTMSQHQHPIPYLMFNERRKPTRFQYFLQRLLGLRRDRFNYGLPNNHMYASSDNNIVHNFGLKRKRRGLRFRKLQRPRRSQSDSFLREVKTPIILTYVQSVQRNCLMDTTPRQCPIMGCRMIFYGIINYNDHLNLCHFNERKYICHYCHEGFEGESDKLAHENEHLGITKLNNAITSAPSTDRQPNKRVNNTQTDTELSKCDVPEEKLKKIVSFFDKIVDSDQILSELKKNRYSESNLPESQTESTENSDNSNIGKTSSETSDKRTISCAHLHHEKMEKNNCMSCANSDITSKCLFEAPVKCRFCGENFEFRRQLSLHVDLEHRFHDKFSKFHSCAGIVNTHQRNNTKILSEYGKIRVDKSSTDLKKISTQSIISDETFTECRKKLVDTASCDPSTNIIYYDSLESVNKKVSLMDSLVQKVKNCYKWEPATKIIHV